jgi:apolipoprotein N-acyltransferase
VLVNLTNDAWFDGASGARQHLLNALFRCVEFRVPMARCANSGETCWIDDRGRIRDRLPATDSRGVPVSGFLSAEIGYRETPAATAYARHGDRFAQVLTVLAALALAGVRGFRRNRPGRAPSVAASKTIAGSDADPVS